ncbi:Hypothetical Protein FCC1311_014802 [Hondaea fermentalgiana]|uniref:CHK kinase-like domain-containing protein n=1 Tax=Hondaea fermentalgiana TaxID=2315210 RepID=A0A2R5G9R3_9STRA|nr:Hypothetical Protein FCC1311_014802 [Hondaea fermentalgiana]|eukprot:GBG25263.1 Hypothetical Protein FCC1311_014802 [Hondaea fermentalgiana]
MAALTRRRVARLTAAAVAAAFLASLVRKVQKYPFIKRALVLLVRLAWERLTRGRDARAAGFVLNEDDVTTTWLDRELKRKFGADKVVVRKLVRRERMGDDMGNASSMFRLTIDYALNNAELPKVMILKTPRDEVASRLAFTPTRMNEMEARFYQDVEPKLDTTHSGVHVPRGIAARFNDDGHFYVLMSDVSCERVRFQTEKDAICDIDTARCIAEGLASFHGPFLGLPASSGLESIIRLDDPVLNMTTQFAHAGWGPCVSKSGQSMSDDLVKRGPQLIMLAQRLNDYMTGGRDGAPATLVHGDSHLANAYFVTSDDASTRILGLYDFQLLRCGNGAIDLASFFAGSAETDFLCEHLDEILRMYLERIHALQDRLTPRDSQSALTELEVLHRDFRLALGLVFCWNVAAGLAIAFDTEAAEGYKKYFFRICAAVDRLGVIDTALAHFGGRELGRNGYRGPEPAWDVPPLQKVLPNADDPAHDLLGYKAFRAQLATLKPGWWNKMKHELKFRLLKRITSSRKGYHGQKTTDLEDAYLEGHHPVDWAKGKPEVETSAFDSFYLSSFAPYEQTGAPSMGLRVCKRPRDEDGEAWIIIKVPGVAIFTWADHPATHGCVVFDTEDSVTVTSKDGKSELRLMCETPMQQWRATFSGKLRNTKTDALVDSFFDVTWTKDMDMFSFGTDVSPGLTARALALETLSREWGDELKAAHQEHFELYGTVKGSLNIGSERYDVHGRGMRDRAFGIRDWGYMQRYLANYFWTGSMESSRLYNVTMASLPVLSNGKFGFVCPPGASRGAPITALSGNFAEIGADGKPSKELWLSFQCDEITYTMKVFVDEGDTVVLNMGPNRQFVNFRFASFEVSWIDPSTGNIMTEKGYGGSEFGYRFADYEPTRPKLSDLSHLPVGQHGKSS